MGTQKRDPNPRNSGATATPDLTASVGGLVQRVLGDPSVYPDAFKSWLPQYLIGNINFTILKSQLPLVEASKKVGATGQAPFVGVWANFGGTNEPALYYLSFDGTVHLGGVVAGGVIGTTIFQLPAGYRPQYALVFIVASNAGLGICTINPDGTVVASSGSNVYFSLSGIVFRQYA